LNFIAILYNYKYQARLHVCVAVRQNTGA